MWSDAFFLEAVHALVENERHFVPAAPGCLYVRPVLMGVDAALGVKSSNDFIFYILTLPSGPYFKDAGEGPGAIDVLVTRSTVRSAPGLMGSVKAGANYAGTLKVTEDAKALGCAQVLFLDARDHKYLEELGGMNVMFVQGNTLRTPPLGDTILNGVTRASLLDIARDLGLETSEAPIAIDEIVAGARNGTITDAMACGTAAVVIGIKRLRVRGRLVSGVARQRPGSGDEQALQRAGRHPVRPRARPPRLGERGLPRRDVGDKISLKSEVRSLRKTSDFRLQTSDFRLLTSSPTSECSRPTCCWRSRRSGPQRSSRSRRRPSPRGSSLR